MLIPEILAMNCSVSLNLRAFQSTQFQHRCSGWGQEQSKCEALAAEAQRMKTEALQV